MTATMTAAAIAAAAIPTTATAARSAFTPEASCGSD